MGRKVLRELTSRQRYWLEHIQSCEASCETTSAYTLAQRLRPRALYDAKKYLVKQGRTRHSGRHRSAASQ